MSAKRVKQVLESTYAIETTNLALKMIPEPVMSAKNSKDKSPIRHLVAEKKEKIKFKLADCAKIYNHRSITVPKKR